MSINQNNRAPADPCIISEDLILENEYQLPIVFSKLLMRRFLEKPRVRLLSNTDLVNAYMCELDSFFHVFLLIRMGNETLKEAGAATDSDSAALMRKRIFNFYYHAINDKYACFPVEVDGFAAFVIELPDFDAESDDSGRGTIAGLESYILEAQEKMLCDFGFVTQVIISDIRHNLGDMPDNFQMILFSIDYIFDIYPGKNVATFLTVLDNVPDTSELRPKPEFERLFFDCIANYDFSMASAILRQRIYEETRNPSTALSVRSRIHSRMAWTLSFLGLPVNRSLLDCVAIYDCADQVLTCRTIDKVYSCVDDFFRMLGAYYRQSTLIAAEKIDMISEYIKENYSDPNLSVGKICEVFNISPAHLSRAFKKKSGIKLIDYIHITRLAQAKTLLENTSKKLSDIAAEVGYSGEWTLIRAFRRFEGQTPGALRADIIKAEKQLKRDRDDC